MKDWSSGGKTLLWELALCSSNEELAILNGLKEPHFSNSLKYTGKYLVSSYFCY